MSIMPIDGSIGSVVLDYLQDDVAGIITTALDVIAATIRRYFEQSPYVPYGDTPGAAIAAPTAATDLHLMGVSAGFAVLLSVFTLTLVLRRTRPQSATAPPELTPAPAAVFGGVPWRREW